MKTLKTSILVIVTIFINLLSLFSYPPGWEIVDVRYDIPDGYRDNTYVTLVCADSANCFIWNEFNAAGGHYFRRTTDGGKTWKNVYQDSAYTRDNGERKRVPDINEIAYPNDKLFIAVGDSGLILRTTDKGETWDSCRLDTKVRLFWLRMLDENYGTAFRRQYYGNKELHMLETTNGGKTWQEMNFVYDGGIEFENYYIINRNQIAAIIWQMKPKPEKKLLMIYNNWEYCDTFPIPLYCNSIDFVNVNQGWIAGGYFSFDIPLNEITQEIYCTSNGGETWIEQRNKPYENLRGFNISYIDFYDEIFGVAESNHAMVFITTDGGKNWQEHQLTNINPNSGSSYPISSICAASPTTAYAILQGDTVYKYTREISDVNEDEYSLANIHPNPATSQIILSLGEEFVSAPEIDIIDYLGNVIRWTPSGRWSPSDKSITINTSPLSPGVYFLRVISGEKVEVKKFVVVR
jgi:photosystem II stability/assembly factor-like uncharacterized protein